MSCVYPGTISLHEIEDFIVKSFMSRCFHGNCFSQSFTKKIAIGAVNKNWLSTREYGCQPKNRGGFTPQIIHFNRVFHYFHHPFWGTMIFGNTHIEDVL